MRSTALSFLSFLVLLSLFSCSQSENNLTDERIKVALRDVGNQLLLANADSTSLVLPVIKTEKYKYQLSFETKLSIEPSWLVASIDSSFSKLNFPKYYYTEVVKCSDQNVAYSFEVNLDQELTIIPCSGRNLPLDCYLINVHFYKETHSVFNRNFILYLLLFSILIQFVLALRKRKQIKAAQINRSQYTSVGSFRFYPEQNKLVKAATEIELSKKECELLAIFVERPNEIIKREELTKRVWEDNGVFVGRSLDTYISKLRKKLKEDRSIKLTNVHGVGYKLEILT